MLNKICKSTAGTSNLENKAKMCNSRLYWKKKKTRISEFWFLWAGITWSRFKRYKMWPACLVIQLCPTLWTPWTVACHAPLSMGFSRQEHWSGLSWFSSVQSLSHVPLFVNPWTAACQVSLPITNSWSLLKLMSIESLMSSNHLIVCNPLLLPPPIFNLQSESFQMSQFLTSGGQSIGVSASASVLPMNIQDWFPLGWTGWISLQSKGLWRVFANTMVQKHQLFSAHPSLWFKFHIHTWLLEKP